jgi:mono/diheme cytochrome c family protein
MGGLLVLALCFPALLFAQAPAQPELPPGEGRELVATVCTQCHGLRSSQFWRAGLPGWKRIVDEMVLRGARITPEEAETIAKYLAQTFGPDSQRAATAGAGASRDQAEARTVVLPAGPGKEVVERRCAACHDLNRVVMQRKSRAEWELVTNDMIARGAQATPQEIQAIVSYLAAQFGNGSR